jgi:hypothetical protein
MLDARSGRGPQIRQGMVSMQSIFVIGLGVMGSALVKVLGEP